MSATNRGIATNVARDAKEGERGGEGVRIEGGMYE